MAERVDGTCLPVEVKFRKRIDAADLKSAKAFLARFSAPHAIIVTRDLFRWDAINRILCVPLLEFLLCF